MHDVNKKKNSLFKVELELLNKSNDKKEEWFLLCVGRREHYAILCR